MIATFFSLRFLAACSARPAPSALSLASRRNVVLKPCVVSFGLVADGVTWGMPHWLYTAEAGMVVPEFR